VCLGLEFLFSVAQTFLFTLSFEGTVLLGFSAVNSVHGVYRGPVIFPQDAKRAHPNSHSELTPLPPACVWDNQP
jgi:hypothetical protein